MLSTILKGTFKNKPVLKGGLQLQSGSGKDGITPHIGENGNWFIGEEDTGIHAEGMSAYEVACIAGFEGTEEEWLESLQGKSGIYVGEGEMPEGYNIQIVPSENSKEAATKEYVDNAIANIDIPTGGGEKEWKLVCDFITEEEVKSFSVDKDIDGNDLYVAPNEETLIFLIAAPTDTNTAKKSAMFLLNKTQISSIPNFIYNGTTNYTRRYIEFGKDPNGALRINKGFEYSTNGNNVFDNVWSPVTEGSPRLAYNSNIANGLVSVGGRTLDGVFGIGSRISVYVKKRGVIKNESI